ncbi:MAG: hypothetical protein ACLFMO_02070 [Eubacteriales bacterium]
MIDNIIKLGALLIAAMIVMILHELPKSMAYIYLNPLQRMQNNNSIYKLRQYIDPIGLIFFVTARVGFSKPFAYRISDKKTNMSLGVVGLASSLCFALIFYSLYRALFEHINIYRFFNSSEWMLGIYNFIKYIFINIVMFNISIFLVNLVMPLVSFDISYIIASKSPRRYFVLHQYEKMLQLLFIILVVFNFFNIILGPIESFLFLK